MWNIIYQRTFSNLLVDPKPKIIISHQFKNRRIAIGLDINGQDWEHLGFLIPFVNTPNGRFEGKWYRLWQGTKMFTLPEEELVGCSLEVKPRNWLDRLTVTVYESRLSQFAIPSHGGKGQLNFIALTQDEYANLPVKDDNTIYVMKEG